MTIHSRQKSIIFVQTFCGTRDFFVQIFTAIINLCTSWFCLILTHLSQKESLDPVVQDPIIAYLDFKGVSIAKF